MEKLPQDARDYLWVQETPGRLGDAPQTRHNGESGMVTVWTTLLADVNFTKPRQNIASKKEKKNTVILSTSNPHVKRNNRQISHAWIKRSNRHRWP